MQKLQGRKIAILATNGFEESELMKPRQRMIEAGARVEIISPESDEIRGWSDGDWGLSVKVDRALNDARVVDYDALILPGGQINPDLLRVNEAAVTFVREFFNTKRPLAAICHAPWLLIEAGVIKGRKATSYKSIRTDMENAGAKWTDEAVVTDKALITSRHPGDLEAFCDKIVEEVLEGRHAEREAA